MYNKYHNLNKYFILGLLLLTLVIPVFAAPACSFCEFINISKGDKGDTGAKGDPGVNGTDGYTPIFGVDYFNGTDGAPGPAGADGTMNMTPNMTAGIIGGFSIPYRFSTTTTAPPADGYIQYNSGTPASVSTIWVEENERGGSEMSTFYNTISIGDKIRIFDDVDITQFHIYNITNIVDSGDYRTISVNTFSGNPSNFANNRLISIGFAPIGYSGSGSGSSINNSYDTIANVSQYVISVNTSMKNYVDGLPSGGDTTSFLFRNGSRIMLGVFNAGGYNVSNITTNVDSDAVNLTLVNAINASMKNYVDLINTSIQMNQTMNQTPNMTAGPQGSSGGTGGRSFYFVDQAQVPPPSGYMTFSSVPLGIPEHDESVIVNLSSGDVLIDEYITDNGTPNVNIVPAGLRSWFTYHYVSENSGTTNIIFYGSIYHEDGSETPAFSGVLTEDINAVDEPTLYQTHSVNPSDYTINTSDRLIQRVYARTNFPGDIVVHFVHDGADHVSYMQTTIGPEIYIRPDGSVPFTGTQSMGGYNLTNITSVVGRDAVNKTYVDNAVAGATGGDTTQFLFLNGTRNMNGTLNMSGYNISNITSISGGDAINLTLASNMNSSMKSYVDSRGAVNDSYDTVANQSTYVLNVNNSMRNNVSEYVILVNNTMRNNVSQYVIAVNSSMKSYVDSRGAVNDSYDTVANQSTYVLNVNNSMRNNVSEYVILVNNTMRNNVSQYVIAVNSSMKSYVDSRGAVNDSYDTVANQSTYVLNVNNSMRNNVSEYVILVNNTMRNNVSQYVIAVNSSMKSYVDSRGAVNDSYDTVANQSTYVLNVNNSMRNNVSQYVILVNNTLMNNVSQYVIAVNSSMKSYVDSRGAVNDSYDTVANQSTYVLNVNNSMRNNVSQYVILVNNTLMNNVSQYVIAVNSSMKSYVDSRGAVNDSYDTIANQSTYVIAVNNSMRNNVSEYVILVNNTMRNNVSQYVIAVNSSMKSYVDSRGAVNDSYDTIANQSTYVLAVNNSMRNNVSQYVILVNNTLMNNVSQYVIAVNNTQIANISLNNNTLMNNVSQYVIAVNSSMKAYVDALPSGGGDTSGFLFTNGSRWMNGNLNMSKFNVSNITSIAGGDAVNLTFVSAMNTSMRNNVSQAIATTTNLSAVYPIGSVYITTLSTDPNVIFGGFGTWNNLGNGYVLVGV